MRDRQLYAQILGIRKPWQVTEVVLDRQQEEVLVRVEAAASARFACPECGKRGARHDTRKRRWRHLDTCQFRTLLEADVPRVRCDEHGVRQVQVPWAEPHSRFTSLFEAVVIDWLKETSISAVAVQLRLSWDEADGIMGRAVRRGLARRRRVAPREIGVDETSFQKRHEYVSVVADLEKGHVIYVGDDRRTETLDEFYETLDEEERSRIRAVTMDMHKPYIRSTRKYVPDAEKKIAFDKFHVAQHLGDALDRVRRQEQKALKAEGNDILTGTRYLWLKHPDNVSECDWGGRFAELRTSTLRTARAYALKETAMQLWDYVSRTWAEKGWKRWLAWALRCRLEPVKKVARMVREHLWGIVNAVILGATNATNESLNAKIQRVKRLACGFRNRARFRNAIYFHLGGLQLYPDLAHFTHTES